MGQKYIKVNQLLTMICKNKYTFVHKFKDAVILCTPLARPCPETTYNGPSTNVQWERLPADLCKPSLTNNFNFTQPLNE